MTNVALYCVYANWLKNQIFNKASDCNVNGVASRWIALRKAMFARGYRFDTFDMYQDLRQIDYWLMIDPWKSTLRFMWDRRINPYRVIMCLHEPPVINPWGWRKMRYYAWAFRGLMTWHSDFCLRYRRCKQYHFPCHFDAVKYADFRTSAKRNLSLMVHANKTSKEPGELYSRRRQIVRHFEKRGDGLLDLYGYGWNDPNARDPFHTSLYQGTTADKHMTYSQYYYAFCIDNSMVPGYITYDPLISMATGTVPIYMPMPDSTRLIPEDTFVNLNAYDSLDALINHLQEMITSGQWEQMRNRGWAFLNSPAYRPFTIDTFCQEMCDGIESLIGRRSIRRRRAA